MVKKYTSEQFWKLYDKLSKELKDAVFAEETGENIYDICKRNGVLENLNSIVEYVGQVLVGVLPPSDFKETLEKELKLEEKIAKKVSQEINRFIFYPVKPSLEELYRMEALPSSPKKPISAAEVSVLEKEKSVSPRKDTYRETVE